MFQTLAGMGLKLRDIGGDDIADLDVERVIMNLRDAGVPARQGIWLSLHPIQRFNRIFLAEGSLSGKFEAMLLVRNHNVGDTAFLEIETLVGGHPERADALLTRMLAYLITRLGTTLAGTPVAILAHTRNPALCRVLRDVAGQIGATHFYPEPAHQAVSLDIAGFAHRLARQACPARSFGPTRTLLDHSDDHIMPDEPMLAVIDLRGVTEPVLDEGARTLFRARLPRKAVRRAVASLHPIRLHPRPKRISAVV